MTTIAEQIQSIEEEIRKTPFHKGTEHHIGKLRAKLSKLKDKEETSSAISKGSGGGGYAVKKQGDATVTLVGPPSAGKSTLINKLTNAKSKIAPYAFTTVTVIPGMMKHKSANIQILDVPGLIEGAEVGRGRGREVLSVVRNSDLLIIMSDVQRVQALDNIVNSLEDNGIRINKTPPLVRIEKKLRGGTVVHSNIKQDLDRQTIRGVAKEFRHGNVEITVREKLTMETLIDAFNKSRVYVPALFVLNKSDMADKNDTVKRIDESIHRYMLISAEKDAELDKLRDAIYNMLGFMRVFLIKHGEQPNNDNPIIVREGTKLSQILQKLGTDFAQGKKGAEIWGPGAKHAGQKVSLSKEAVDNMQVRFV